MGYSVAYEYNFNIMVIFQGVALLLYGLYRFVYWHHQRSLEKGETEEVFEASKKGKFFGLFTFDFFVYWTLINMNQILIGTVVQG